MSLQFNEGEICQLIRACECYQDRTGSDYMFARYQKLIHKLNNYGEEHSPTHLQCELNQYRDLNDGIRHNPGNQDSSSPEQGGETGREARGPERAIESC